MRDLYYGLRGLWRNRSFATIALLSLALSVGANTLIFSVLDSVLLKPLGYPESDRLVAIWSVFDDSPEINRTSSLSTYFAIRDYVKSFESVGAFNAGACGVKSLGAGDAANPAMRLYGQCFSPSLLELFGVIPARGRTFTDAEDQVGNVAPVILLGNRLWQSRFGGRDDVIGQTVPFNGVPTTIIGVLPEDFVLFRDPNTPLSRPTDLDFVIPLEMSVQQTQSRVGGSTIVARLAEGVSIAQAQAELDSVLRGVADENPGRNGGISGRIVSLREVAFGRYRTSVLLLQAAVACVLIVGCANIAGLLLARNRRRRGELAMRLALGAERTRVVRQLIAETLPLSAVGGALGVFVAWGGLELFAALVPGHFSQLGKVSLDLRVLAFTAAVVIATTFLFATIPAAQTLKIDLVEPLKEGGRSSIGGARRQRARELLVGGQIAFATLLLIGAGLLLSSFVHVMRTDLGAQPDGLLTFDFHLPQRDTVAPLAGRYQGMGLVRINEKPALTVERVLQRVQSMPGVIGVAAAGNPPLGGFGMALSFEIEGADLSPPGSTGPPAIYTAVTGDYFDVMKIALEAGRPFDDSDTADGAPVVVINQALARQFFDGASPLGRRLTLNLVPDDVSREIVGVVGDTALGPLEREPSPTIYVPHLQQSRLWAGPAWGARSGMYFVVRTNESLQAFMPALARAVAEVDASTPVADVKTVAQAVSGQLEDLQLAVLLVGVFAFVAVVLAAIGIYGVIALAVADRAKEIALRMVVGAGASQIVQLILTDMAWFVGSGLAAGLLVSLAASRLLGGALYGVAPMDPLTYAAVSLLFIAIAIGACLVPARRAVTIDAMSSLRAD